MRITHAQPLVPGARGGQLEPVPRLSPEEAEAEASALASFPGFYDVQAVAEAPPEWFGGPVEEFLAETLGRLYTHRLRLRGAPENVCTDYLVRMED